MRVGQLATFGHAQFQAERAEHPHATAAAIEEIEILPNEHEQRDVADAPIRTPKLPNSIPESSSGAGTS